MAEVDILTGIIEEPDDLLFMTPQYAHELTYLNNMIDSSKVAQVSKEMIKDLSQIPQERKEIRKKYLQQKPSNDMIQNTQNPIGKGPEKFLFNPGMRMMPNKGRGGRTNYPALAWK